MTDDRGIKEVFFEPGRLCVVCVHPFTFPQQRLKCNQYLIKYVRHMHSATPAIALLDVRALFYHSPVARLLQYPALQVSHRGAGGCIWHSLLLCLSLSATQIPPHKHSVGNGCLPLVFGFLSENLTGVFASISSRGSAWSSGPGETLMPCRCSLLSDPDVQLSSLGRFLLNPKP